MKSIIAFVAVTALAIQTVYAHISADEIFPMRRHARRAGHKHQHKRHDLLAVKRSTQCQFPTNVGLVPVTPNQQNAGWAMSPDQPCLPGNYCPYACPSGQVSMQWDPAATSYTYPLSMHGGLYCDSNGNINKPFPNQPYCVNGVGNVFAVNEVGQELAFCQTVLPGNEAMLIPTSVGVGGQSTLAVPGTSYWCSTAAEYYINPPGITTDQGCIWGDGSQPIGNWSPFVAGANQVANGDTFVMIGVNPIYCCQSSWSGTNPGFGVRIECPGGGCNGVPCECNPDTMGTNGCTGGSTGAGGAQFCIVTVPAGGTANIVVFSLGSNSTSSTASSAASSSQPQVSAGSSPAAESSPAANSPAPVLVVSVPPSAKTKPTTAMNGTSTNSLTSSSTDTESVITIYPTGLGLDYDAGHPLNSNPTQNTTTPKPTPAAQSPSPAPHSSGSDALSKMSMNLPTILTLMGIVAVGMFNL